MHLHFGIMSNCWTGVQVFTKIRPLSLDKVTRLIIQRSFQGQTGLPPRHRPVPAVSYFTLHKR